MRTKLFLRKASVVFASIVLVFIVLVCGLVDALIVPHGLSGRVVELDGITPVSVDAYFSINNTNNGFLVEGKVGRLPGDGRYVAAVNGADNDLLVVRVWTPYHESRREVVLKGVMNNVDLVLNTTLPVYPPVFISLPFTSGKVGEQYYYQASAFDEDADTLSYSLIAGPVGMSINSTSGLLSYLPTMGGTWSVVISVTDGIFAVNQSFTLVVQNVNHPPVFTSTPIASADENVPYNYSLVALDIDNDSLQFVLLSGPKGMFLNNSKITFLPSHVDVGVHVIKLMVLDGDGASALQSFNLTVYEAHNISKPLENTTQILSLNKSLVNHKPIFVSTPLLNTSESSLYLYAPKLQEQHRNTQLFSLQVAPEGMVVDVSTGKVFWNPSIIGIFNVSLLVEDGLSNATQDWSIVVYPVSHPPNITSIPITVAYVGSKYSYQIVANGSKQLFYSLVQAPPYMVVDPQSGLVNWIPSPEDTGTKLIILKVNDSQLVDIQQFFVAVHENDTCLAGCMASYNICQVSPLTSRDSCITDAKRSFSNCGSVCPSCASCTAGFFLALQNCSAVLKSALDLCSKDRDGCISACSPSGALESSSLVVLDRRPLSSAPIARSVYKYLDIKGAGTNVSFAVDQLWLARNSLTPSDIVLARFHDGQWQDLNTTFLREVGALDYFVAKTPGFSYFAISSIKPAPVSGVTIQRQLKEPLTLSGLLYDNGVEVSEGTRFTVVDKVSGAIYEGLTGIGPYKGAFFIILDSDLGSGLEIKLENFAASLKAKENAPFSIFNLNRSTGKVDISPKGFPKPYGDNEPYTKNEKSSSMNGMAVAFFGHKEFLIPVLGVFFIFAGLLLAYVLRKVKK